MAITSALQEEFLSQKEPEPDNFLNWTPFITSSPDLTNKSHELQHAVLAPVCNYTCNTLPNVNWILHQAEQAALSWHNILLNKVPWRSQAQESIFNTWQHQFVLMLSAARVSQALVK